jgi:hypothetical protein
MESFLEIKDFPPSLPVHPFTNKDFLYYYSSKMKSPMDCWIKAVDGFFIDYFDNTTCEYFLPKTFNAHSTVQLNLFPGESIAEAKLSVLCPNGNWMQLDKRENIKGDCFSFFTKPYHSFSNYDTKISVVIDNKFEDCNGLRKIYLRSYLFRHLADIPYFNEQNFMNTFSP